MSISNTSQTEFPSEFPCFDQEDVGSIWIGSFPSEDAFESYIDSAYDEDGNSTNRFSIDSGLGWFDHDFQEASYHPRGLAEPRKSLTNTSYIDSFIHDAEPVIRQNATTNNANSILLRYNYTYSEAYADKAAKAGCKLTYIGTFPYST